MQPRYVTAVLCALALGGCAASYPPLRTARNPEGVDPSRGVGRVLADAETLQGQYSKNYRTVAKAADLSQIPIIGVAAVAAGLLLHNGPHAARNVGYVAIGAGSYTAARGVFLPASLAEIYIRGHAALGCVRNEGALFAGSAAVTRYDEFVLLAKTLAQHDELARQIYESASLSSAATPQQRSTFATGMRQLAEARAAAATTLRATRADLASYGSADFVFDSAVSAVTVRVATKGREGRAVDFATLKASLTASIPNNGPPVGPTSAAVPGDDDQLNQLITSAAANLSAATQDVVAATPHYADALTRVAACPNTI